MIRWNGGSLVGRLFQVLEHGLEPVAHGFQHLLVLRSVTHLALHKSHRPSILGNG